MKTNIGFTTALLSLSNIFVSSCTLILSVFFARILSKEDYGTYLQVMLLINTGALLFSLGIPNSIMYYLTKRINHVHFLWQTFILLFSIGLLNGVVIYFFDEQISNFMNNKRLIAYIPQISVCITSYLVYHMVNRILIATGKGVTFAIISALVKVNFFILTLVALSLKSTINTLIIIVTFQHIILFLITIYILFSFSDNSLHYEKVRFRTQVVYSLPLAASTFLAVLSKELDKYIVSISLTPTMLATYSRGAIDLPFVHIFTYSLSQVLFPQYVKLFDDNNLEEVINLWHKGIVKIALILIPIFFYFIVVADDFILGLYSDKYRESIPIFITYLFLIPVQITTYGTTLMAKGKNTYILICTIFSLVLNAILSIFLIKQVGLIGPAIATIVSTYLVSWIYLKMNQKILHVGMINIFPWVKLFKIVSISFGLGVMIYAIKPFLNFSLYFSNDTIVYISNMLALALIYFVMYLIVCIKVKMLGESELELLRRFIPKP